MLTALTTRFPPANVLVAETYVQGPRAAPALATALGDVARAGVDVIVLARGGGSFEDLLPFSDERLVRAIAACPVPVVSAVGHEQDTPLSDLVADARASTPSLAARLVVPDLGELLARLDRSREALGRATSAALTRDRERIDRSRGAVHAAIRALAAAQDRRLETTRERLDRAPRLDLERRQAKLKQTAGRLRALSPRATLERGYAIVHGPEGVVTDSGQVESGTEVSVDLARGGFGARVEETR